MRHIVFALNCAHCTAALQQTTKNKESAFYYVPYLPLERRQQESKLYTCLERFISAAVQPAATQYKCALIIHAVLFRVKLKLPNGLRASWAEDGGLANRPPPQFRSLVPARWCQQAIPLACLSLRLGVQNQTLLCTPLEKEYAQVLLINHTLLRRITLICNVPEVKQRRGKLI